MAAKFGVFVDEGHSRLPALYWLPKLHKRPFKSKKEGKVQESIQSSTTPISRVLLLILVHVHLPSCLLF